MVNIMDVCAYIHFNACSNFYICMCLYTHIHTYINERYLNINDEGETKHLEEKKDN